MGQIASKFVELFAEVSSERYSQEEGTALQQKMVQLAKQQLPELFGFKEDEINQMTNEELVMRWVYAQYCRLRTQAEPLISKRPSEVIAAKNKIVAENEALLKATGAKSSPYPIVLPQAILVCRTFERRVKFLQTIEAIRDYAGKNDGQLPESLDDLYLQLPTTLSLRNRSSMNSAALQHDCSKR